ncbi:MAG: polyprenol monophosphomannose synthase [bacterium]|nr:polyprenol monophosphomannose synthase [bacterium]
MEELEQRLSVVVPTYREADNLRPLCERVFAATRASAIEAEMIIVDDDSDDGSEAIVAELANDFDVRIVVRRGERGLSSAVVRGFEEARHEVLLVMDADLSHPPEKVPELARKVFDGEAEFVVGSRYVGGGEMRDWPFLRRLNSWVATVPARLLTPVRDPMAGFFCLRRETWRRAERLNPIGYKIALELMVKCRCRRYAEVPIVFTDRLHGTSKLTFWQQLLYLRQLCGLYVFRFPGLVIGGILLGLAGLIWLVWVR